MATDKQISDTEQAIVLLSNAMGLTEQKVCEILRDGVNMNDAGSTLVKELLNEADATFDNL